MPLRPSSLDTTGVPAAKASSALFFMPAPDHIGISAAGGAVQLRHDARHRPDHVDPRCFAELLERPADADDAQPGLRTGLQDQRHDVADDARDGFDVRLPAEVADEHQDRRAVTRVGERELLRVHGLRHDDRLVETGSELLVAAGHQRGAVRSPDGRGLEAPQQARLGAQHRASGLAGVVARRRPSPPRTRPSGPDGGGTRRPRSRDTGPWSMGTHAPHPARSR